MIETLLIGSCFLTIILIAGIVLHLNARRWGNKMEEINKKRFDELSKRVDDLKTLFTTGVKRILDATKDIIT